MKKIDAILKGKKLVDKLFNLRQKKIMRELESAKDDVERQKTEAEIRYEELCKNLAEDGVSYKSTINRMIGCKETLINSEATLVAIDEIIADLNSEVEVKYMFITEGDVDYESK